MSPLEVTTKAAKVIPIRLAAGIVLLLLSAALCPPVSGTIWHTIHNIFVFSGIILGFIIFFLTWYGTACQTGLQITVISLTLLWVSVLDSAHLLTGPSLKQTINHPLEIVWLLYSVFSRLVWSSGMLYASKTQQSSPVSPGMQKIVLLFATLVIAVFTANIYISSYIWPFTDDAAKAAPLIRSFLYVAILLQSTAFYFISMHLKHQPAYSFFSRAMLFGIMTDVVLVIAVHEQTWLSLSASVFRLLSFYYLLRLVYIIVIRKPYEDVQAMKDEMEALASNNEQLYQASLKQCDLMEETLVKVGILISSRLNLSETYRAIADMVTDMMGAGQSCVALLSENHTLLHVVATCGISAPPETMPYDSSLTGAAIAARKAQLVSDLSQRPDLFKPQLVFSDIYSVISAPLFDDKEIIGGVEAYANEKNAFTSHDCLLLQALGRHAGAAIAGARQYEETKVRLAEEQFLYQITQAAASTMDPDTILTQCLPVVIQALRADQGICLICSDSGSLLFVKAALGCQVDSKEIVLSQNPALASAIHSRKPSIISAEALPGYNGKPELIARFLCLPLVLDRRILGLMLIQGSKYSPSEDQRKVSFAALMVQQIALGLEKAHLYNQVKTMALSDGLTGLANRRNFDMFLEAELRRSDSLKRPLSLIMLDLDRFKSYNDTYGHLIGDQLLSQIGQILRQNVRGIDFPARYGGEEFSVILPECSNPEAVLIAENIRQAVEVSQFPDNHGSYTAKITASLGVATYNPQLLPDPPSKEQLIAIADKALYRAKQDGRNQVSNATVLGQ